DGGGFEHARVRDDDRLHFRRTEALARELDRVVGPAVQEPLPVVRHAREVAVPPHVGPARPVGIEVALRIAVEAAGHARPRLRAESPTATGPARAPARRRAPSTRGSAWATRRGR